MQNKSFPNYGWAWKSLTHLFNKQLLKIIYVLKYYSRSLGYVSEKKQELWYLYSSGRKCSIINLSYIIWYKMISDIQKKEHGNDTIVIS